MNKELYINEIQALFDNVQRSKVFEDQKMMTDAVPLFSISEINAKYEQEKQSGNFDLKEFVMSNFDFLGARISIQREDRLPIDEHIEKLWDELTRTAYEEKGTLLKLPQPYVVPGGRFNEFFYWDSYFIMLGLQVSGRVEMMKNIIENCSYLIQTVGFVPNASRTHFLSRSQPPYFSLMLDLLFETTRDENIYIKYHDTLEKEYAFWMNGSDGLENGSGVKRVVKTMDGDILNRYYDAENEPRPESYLIDIEDSEKASGEGFYRNIRSACESGWDFSSRWFADGENIQTIETLNIAQVDLNCLIWHLEKTLARSSAIQNFKKKENYFTQKEEKRKSLIQKYFWDESADIFKDFHIKKNQKTTSTHIAALYPLFLNLVTIEQAKKTAKTIEGNLLYRGGLATTTKQTGQQWDFPNAWAPYQWLGFKAMKNYGFDDLADKIKNNWCSNVERVYTNTGKLMEKYNVMDTDSIAGGGEYPNQDGFGWTNGVYLKLKQN
ncbi:MULTISPECIES: trehalase family glycosidase [Chryseobacterium]|uniref:trehalase family glycosidase n=1 Tax=Chryseobacterium TaxID=59732 RepID=UPI00195AB244|nr:MULTISPECIES: trehalase family glycosidase [Chryseobacterium]MBM7420237.1 alpha,alpha-trehalase [Chryseobacterium sp. JUb44]MDH6210179.1 alpha,alpha-trehalase [Chryseobacterium sp. BIGb0186]WSO08900.1 trehalase family glycosidase [Chryseobacterium scophthalmum]